MIRLLCLLLTSLLLACSNTDAVIEPPDTIDQYTGTTWSRPDANNTINGKQVYHYLTFKKNFQIDSYIKYSRSQSTTDQAETATYTYGGRLFLITFKSGTYPADFLAAGLTVHYPSGDVSYIKD